MNFIVYAGVILCTISVVTCGNGKGNCKQRMMQMMDYVCNNDTAKTAASTCCKEIMPSAKQEELMKTLECQNMKQVFEKMCSGGEDKAKVFEVIKGMQGEGEKDKQMMMMHKMKKCMEEKMKNQVSEE